MQGGACAQDEVALVQRGADVHRAHADTDAAESARRDGASAESATGLIKQGWPWGEPDETSSLVLQLGHHSVGHVSSDKEPQYPQLHAHVPAKRTKVGKPKDKKADEAGGPGSLAASLWSRIGAVNSDIGAHVIFPEDDEGTGTLSGNSPSSLVHRPNSVPSGSHKVFVRRQWAVVKQNSYCASHRKLLPWFSGRIRVPRCQEMAAADSDCGDTIYSNGETDCYCVLAGNECELKTSGRSNSVFRRLLPLAMQDDEPTLLRRWSRMRKKKRAAAAMSNERHTGPGKNSTTNSSSTSSTTEEEEAPPGVKLIAMPPALGARLRIISIIFFLAVPAVMTSWCVTNVLEK